MSLTVTKPAINLREVAHTVGKVVEDTPSLRAAIRNELNSYVDLGSVSGTIVIDLSKARVDFTVSGATTLSYFNYPPEGETAGCIMRITNGGAYTITGLSTGEWEGGVVPTLTTSGKDDIAVMFEDGNTTPTFYLMALDVQ